MEGSREGENFATVFFGQRPQWGFACAVRLYASHTTCYLAFIVTRLKLITLNGFLVYIREGGKTLHEALETIEQQSLTHHLLRVGIQPLHIHQVVHMLVTPVGLIQPIPLKGQLLLKVHQLVCQVALGLFSRIALGGQRHKTLEGITCQGHRLASERRVDLVMTAREGFAKDYPNALNLVVKTQRKALQWINGHWDEAVALGAKEHGIRLDDAKKLAQWSNYYDTLTNDDIKGLVNDQFFLVENGMMAKKVNVRTLVLPTALH